MQHAIGWEGARVALVVGALALLGAVGCSCSDPGDPDGGEVDGGALDGGAPRDAERPDATRTRCGNSMVEAGEECDDGNDSEDDACNNDCTLTCGDGVVNMIELCDPGIAAGEPGACPTDCDDAMACTSDVLSGTGCDVECLHADISACLSDDGCCPSGCDATSDNDCAATCGNGVIEPGETCEAGVGAGCPASCDDMVACTTDTIAGDASTCDVSCTNAPITTCTNGDGCCGPGCDSTTDDDCSASCGNGVIEAGETCEAGVGAGCPTSCDDMMVCTRDVLSGSAASCDASCSNTAITTCTNADGCCAPGCNALVDDDCMSVCGNMIVEPGEGCDDGNTDPMDGCDMCTVVAGPTVFRMSDLDLRDPHAFASVPFFGCQDITNTVVGMDGVNPQFQASIQNDGDADGLLDLSFVMAFRPLDQVNGATHPADLYEADCTAPAASTSCAPTTGGSVTRYTYTSATSGTCLSPVTGTTRASYTPAIGTPGAPCWSTDAQDLTLVISGIAITLRDAQLGATYVGAPATLMSNGLLRGFLTVADAEATVLPSTLPIVGGSRLAEVLRGYPGNPGLGIAANCSGSSDMDTHPTHGAGWWMYLNFPASQVTWTGP